MSLDINAIRSQFPILETQVRNKKLVYFDNGATSQKPLRVINRISHYYLHENSNVHRGVHFLSQLATDAMEQAREKLVSFVHAESIEEIIFTKGTTESINLVAHSFGNRFVGAEDEIIISEMEHHANLVPWQFLCKDKGAKLRVIKTHDDGSLDLNHLQSLIGPKTRLISIAHVSNVTGVINPVEEVVKMAQDKGIFTLIDGAQASSHLQIDVQKLGCTFYVFSAHKMYGPMGVGVLYGQKAILEQMPPYQSGGEMIDRVCFSEETTFNVLPFKFEAGTPMVPEIIAFAEAIDFINEIGFEKIQQHEHELLSYATEKLLAIDGLKIIGTHAHKSAVISFVLQGLHPYDVGSLLDQMGFALRTGNHCAQPFIQRHGVSGTVRLSLAIYNTLEEVDLMVEALKKVKNMLS